MSVHRGDLAVVGSGIRDALRHAPNWCFEVVGETRGVAEELGLRSGDITGTGWLPIDEYPEALTRLSIGIVPIADTSFNRSKSWLKSLDLAASGVPHVASNMPEYRRLGAASALVTKPKQWKAALLDLVYDPERRAAEAERGVELARRWTYEANVDRWWAAWVGAPVRPVESSISVRSTV